MKLCGVYKPTKPSWGTQSSADLSQNKKPKPSITTSATFDEIEDLQKKRNISGNLLKIIILFNSNQ